MKYYNIRMVPRGIKAYYFMKCIIPHHSLEFNTFLGLLAKIDVISASPAPPPSYPVRQRYRERQPDIPPIPDHGAPPLSTGRVFRASSLTQA